MSEQGEVKPGKLPAMRTDEVIARAQKIYDHLGEPPYTPMNWQQHFEEAPHHRTTVSEEEAAIITEHITYWLPYLKRKG